MAKTATAPPPMVTSRRVALENELFTLKCQLGEAVIERDACKLDELPLDGPLAQIRSIEQEIANCEGALVELQRREERRTKEEKAEAERIAQAIEMNIRGQIHVLVLEGDKHISDLHDWGLRMAAAIAAGRGLGNDTLNHQLNEINRGLRLFLGHALKNYPGFDTGATPFLHLDERKFASIFPDPKTSTPPKRKAK